MKNVYIIICVMFGFTACSDEKPTGDYLVIDVAGSIGKYQKVYFSELFSLIELVPLETKKECLLDVVPNPAVLINDNFIFMRGDGHLYIFDRTGKFLNQVGKRGQGPGEYTDLHSIFFNTDRQTVYVEDVVKISEYDFAGKFLRSFHKPRPDDMSLSKIAYAGDDLFIGQMNYHGKNKYKYCLFDQHGNTVKCFLSHVFFNRERSFSSTFDSSLEPVRVENRLYLKDFLNDTIYVLENSNVQPAYVFEFGKYSFLNFKEYLEIFNKQDPVPRNAFIVSHTPGGFVATPKYFFYIVQVPSFSHPPQSKPVYLLDRQISTRPYVHGFYDITQRTNVFLDTDDHLQKGIINDINGGLSFIPRYYAGNDVLVDVWNADIMKEILTNEYFSTQSIKDPQANQKLKDILKNLKEDDNPVVVIAKLK